MTCIRDSGDRLSLGAPSRIDRNLSAPNSEHRESQDDTTKKNRPKRSHGELEHEDSFIENKLLMIVT
jgi:hypothetical protein